MGESTFFLVQGLFLPSAEKSSRHLTNAMKERATAIEEHGDALGVLGYEQISGANREMANRFLRLARGTAQAVDAVEVFEVDKKRLRRSLTKKSGRDDWQAMACCAGYGFDASRCFILMGRLRLLVDGPVTGQRVLWFGRGLHSLSDDEFIEHYTGHHGPLVARNAEVLGIRRYQQVANDEDELCDPLRELGLGQAQPPPVFAELAMGAPPLNLKSLRARRSATQAIKTDEKRHIDFPASMLLLA